MRTPFLLVAAIAALFASTAQASCGAAYCPINTDLAGDASGIVPGGSFELRYEDIRQDQPRSGSDRIAVGQIRRHHDEVRTRNRNLIGTYRHTFESGWGVSVTAPLIDRDHLHVHNHRGAQLPEEWNYRELGDVRVTGRYQKALAPSENAQRTVGAIAGLKLPTGRTGIANSAGDVAERTLQPGTGTTDLVLGGFYHHQYADGGSSWFAQAQVQHALNEHEGFRPGAQLALDLSYTKNLRDKLAGIVQLNAVVKRRDSGAQAEPADSGSRALYLSPGFAYELTDKLRVYAFYQHPLYQHVHGVQLTTRRAVLVGLNTRF